MTLFDGGPLGRWPFPFTFLEDLGCAIPFIGFVAFLVVVTLMRHFLF
jgi:hypothetical protein